MLLLHGDCLEVMKTLADKSIDLFICDLPYGALNPNPPTTDNVKASKTGCPWDVKIDLEQFWTQVRRLARDDHTPVIHFTTTKFGVELINSNPDWFRYDLVWNKMRGVGFLQVNRMPMRSHEMIYVFSKKGAKYYRNDIEGKPYFKKSTNKLNTQYNVDRVESLNEGKRCVLSVIDCYNSDGHHRKKRISNHPTEKPRDLYEWLITRYSKIGDTVLDPTAGSFTSVFTANDMGRNSIGIEKDNDFFTRAEASIKN
jgi:site-specific DNA-methyltransferase (adenine-specific)